MELTLAGKRIVTEERKKSLGLIVSQNMNWTDHVNDTVRKCKFKLRSLKKLGGVVTEDQRKKLVEGVILSRLHQHLEVVSMGRRVAHCSETKFNSNVPQLTGFLQIIISYIYLSYFIAFLKYFTEGRVKNGPFFKFWPILGHSSTGIKGAADQMLP